MGDDNKIKAWITWPDGSEFGWYHCTLLLENGWPIYGHLCSSPRFAPGDLWFGRKERQEEWKKAGLELEIVDQCPYSKLPAHVLENNKKEAYVEWAEKHFGPLEKDKNQPSVKVEFAEEKTE